MKNLAVLLAFLVTNGSQVSAFDTADLQKLKDTNYCRKCDLSNADLVNGYLKGTDLNGANLNSANLKGANLKGANLKHTKLHFAFLWYADLEGVRRHN